MSKHIVKEKEVCVKNEQYWNWDDDGFQINKSGDKIVKDFNYYLW